MNKQNIATISLLSVIAFCLCGCTWGTNKWEYKVVTVQAEGHERSGAEAAKNSSVTPSEEMLNKLGNEGWELSTSYLEMETAWYNFGKGEYVIGLQPNIRPQRVVLIFKRRASLLSKIF